MPAQPQRPLGSGARSTAQLAAAGPPTQTPLQLLCLLPPLLLFCSAHLAPQVDMGPGQFVNWPGKGPSRMCDCDQLALFSLQVAALAMLTVQAHIAVHDSVRRVLDSVDSTAGVKTITPVARQAGALSGMQLGIDPKVVTGGRLAALASRMARLQEVQHTAYRDVLTLAAQLSSSLMGQLAASQRRPGAGMLRSRSSSSSSAGASASGTTVLQKTAVQLLCVLNRCDDAWRVTTETKRDSSDAAEGYDMGPGTWDDAYPDSSSSGSVAVEGPASDLYSQHAVQLCQMLEAAVRCRTAVPDLNLLVSSRVQKTRSALLCGYTDSGVYAGAPLLTAAVQGGADSPQAMQLWSVLSSILKLSLLPQSLQLPALQAADSPVPWPILCESAFVAASALVSPGTYQHLGLDNSPRPEAAMCWVVLLGRCCMLLGRLLTAAAAKQGEFGTDMRAVLLSTSRQMLAFSGSAAMIGDSRDHDAQHRVQGLLDSADRGVNIAGSWLTINILWLSSRGYPLATLHEMRHQALATTAAVQDLLAQVAAFRVEPSTLSSTAQVLQDCGTALSALAISCSCNNPTCTSLQGPSELQLARGRNSKCSACKVARYCSRECQASHWQLHKPVCKAMGAVAV